MLHDNAPSPTDLCLFLTISRRVVFFYIISRGVRLSELGTAGIMAVLYQPQMIDDGDCGAIDGMKIGRKPLVLKKNLP
jgi:hypothetical protein